jgi:hypothetical protein
VVSKRHSGDLAWYDDVFSRAKICGMNSLKLAAWRPTSANRREVPEIKRDGVNWNRSGMEVSEMGHGGFGHLSTRLAVHASTSTSIKDLISARWEFRRQLHWNLATARPWTKQPHSTPATHETFKKKRLETCMPI